MDETSRRDIIYEGCFSGPAGVDGWLGGAFGCLSGMVAGALAASVMPPAAVPVVAISVWIAWTVLFVIFFRMRCFSVRLRTDGLEIATRRRVRSISYDRIRLVDAGVWLDTFKGGPWSNARARLREADGRLTRIKIDRVRASSLVAELRSRCPRAGGIDLDELDWLPDDPTSRREARLRLRRILLARAAVGVVLGGGWLACLAALAVAVVFSHRPREARDWAQLAVALTAGSFALRTLRRGARAWSRRNAARAEAY